MDVASIINNSKTTQQVAPKDTTSANADRFLTMLVAQLKNQDPLNPMDNAQVTTQMAQISTVEGINKLNETIQSLALGFNANSSLQAAGMVGRMVMTEGNALALTEEGGRGGYQLDGAADGLALTVKSASGAIVHKAELGKQDAGMHLFEWDGKTDSGTPAAPGLYSFEITARQGKDTVAASTLQLARVNGVTPGATPGAETKLDLGMLGQTSLAGIKHIF